jgi:hypothetical protein
MPGEVVQGSTSEERILLASKWHNEIKDFLRAWREGDLTLEELEDVTGGWFLSADRRQILFAVIEDCKRRGYLPLPHDAKPGTEPELRRNPLKHKAFFKWWTQLLWEDVQERLADKTPDVLSVFAFLTQAWKPQAKFKQVTSIVDELNLRRK